MYLVKLWGTLKMKTFQISAFFLIFRLLKIRIIPISLELSMISKFYKKEKHTSWLYFHIYYFCTTLYDVSVADFSKWQIFCLIFLIIRITYISISLKVNKNNQEYLFKFRKRNRTLGNSTLILITLFTQAYFK